MDVGLGLRDRKRVITRPWHHIFYGKTYGKAYGKQKNILSDEQIKSQPYVNQQDCDM